MGSFHSPILRAIACGSSSTRTKSSVKTKGRTCEGGARQQDRVRGGHVLPGVQQPDATGREALRLGFADERLARRKRHGISALSQGTCQWQYRPKVNNPPTVCTSEAHASHNAIRSRSPSSDRATEVQSPSRADVSLEITVRAPSVVPSRERRPAGLPRRRRGRRHRSHHSLRPRPARSRRSGSRPRPGRE
jgi:hypothetical protein